MTVIPASCPQCGAQYQLTSEHLAVANGKVRCGVCNTVFQAVTPPVAPQQAQPTPAQAPVRKPAPTAPKSQFVNEDDDLMLSDELDNVDEAGALFNDAPEERSKIKTSEFSNEFANFSGDDSDSFGSSDEFDDDFSSDSPRIKAKSDELHADEEDEWVSKLLEEEGIDADEVIKRPEKVEKSESSKDSPRKALGSSIDDFDFDLDGLDGAPLSLSSEEQEAYGFGESETKEGMIRNIKPEPLVLQLLHKTSLLSNIGLGILAFLATVGIAFQLFYFQKDTLSRDPSWHGFYDKTCGILGCNLPSQFSITDIQATNLTVKSHPHYRESLLVDALIINRAGILQPFPNIELFFTDTSQKVVAARQFKPAEYLRGELAETSLMPSKQSIHIALEINDPGTDATGYFIKLSY